MTIKGLVLGTIILLGGLIVGFAMGGLIGLLIAFVIAGALAAMTVYGYGGKRQSTAPELYLNIAESENASEGEEQRNPTGDKNQLPKGFYLPPSR